MSVPHFHKSPPQTSINVRLTTYSYLMDYKKRVIDSELQEALRTSGAVLLEGARGCGKTSSALKVSASSVRLDLDVQLREIASFSPEILLPGETPRLIDEWQLAPEVFNQIRAEVDARQDVGQFLLTGSSKPIDTEGIHPGSHRFLRLRMRPLTMTEWSENKVLVSLADVLAGKNVSGRSGPTQIKQLASEICKGGWPILQKRSVSQAQALNRSYLEDVYRADFHQVRPGSDSDRARAVVQALARNVSTETSNRALAQEVGARLGFSVEPETVASYLQALADLSLIENIQPWLVHLRSKDIVRKSAKRYFVDPSLAAAALGATPDNLIADLETFGLMFENLVVKDLLVYAQSLDMTLRHFRDSSGLEVDVVLIANNGDWFGVEVKLNPKRADQASKQLQKFREKLDSEQTGKCLGLAVITYSELSYKRPDGVYLLGINQLTV